MSREKFTGGCPKGVESLMAGKIDFGEGYNDVRAELEELTDRQQKSVLLLVTCDRIYGFFENRGGIASGPRLRELVRELAEELKLTLAPSRNDDADVTAIEAKNYYDQLVAMGVLELAEGIGVRDVFCTVWGMVNEMVGKPD